MSTLEKKKALTKNQCHNIYVEAYEAGMKAGNEVGVPKFVVGTPTTPLGNDIDFKKETFIMDGLCGFAWVTIKPARGAFVNYLKGRQVGSNGYYGGFEIWVREFGQSVDRKTAFARAFADVLNKYGINASVGSRLD